MSKIVTLTTDWHKNDYYIGAVKSAIISQVRDVYFVDISHQIEHYSVFQAAFVLKNSFLNFPSDTVHIIGVDSEPDVDGLILVARYNGQYFISGKNPCLGLVFSQKPEIVVEVETGYGFTGCTFPEMSVFSLICSFILKGGDIKELGNVVDDVPRTQMFNAEIGKDYINGHIIYIDSYGNTVTNITKEEWYDYVGDKKFEMSFSNTKVKITSLSISYRDVEPGDLLCIFNSIGLLEIAIRNGNASQLLNLKIKSEVRIKF